MSYELVAGDGWKRSLKFRIPAEEVQVKYAESLKQAQKLYSLPGFRPGKVPVQIIEKRLSEQLVQDALETIRHESYEAALKESKIGALGIPHFADDEPYTRGGDYLFSAEFEIEPEFELPQYKGMEIEKPRAVVTDEDVTAEMESLRFRSGKWEPTEGRAVAETDRVSATVEVHREGELVGTLENAAFTSRANGLKGFELPNLPDLMAGAVVGDEREAIAKVNGGVEGIENLEQGEDVTLKIRVNEVSVLHLPELNDEFAKNQDFETLEDMRNAMRNQLVQYKSETAERHLKSQMIRKLTESCDFEPPAEITARQSQANYTRELERYRRMGVDIEQLEDGRHIGAFRNHAAAEARNTIKLHFIVDKIAEKERIFCTESELMREIEMMSNRYHTTPQKMRQMLEDEDMLEQIRVDIRERKVFNLIMAKATITEVDAPSEPMDHDHIDDADDHDHEHGEGCDCGHDH